MKSFLPKSYAKVSGTVNDKHNKIQLCVCFPTENTQQLSLIYKATKPDESIPIVSLTTPKGEFDRAPGFDNLNELYYILSSIANAENSGFLMNEELDVTVNGDFVISTVLPNIPTIDILNNRIKYLKTEIEAGFKLSNVKYLLNTNNIINYKTSGKDKSYKISRFDNNLITLTTNSLIIPETIGISYDDFFKNMSITNDNIEKIATKINSDDELEELNKNSKNFVLLIRVLNSKDNFKPYYYQTDQTDQTSQPGQTGQTGQMDKTVRYISYDQTITHKNILNPEFQTFEIYATKITASDDDNILNKINEIQESITKITSQSAGGNPIPTPKPLSNHKTTKKQRRQRKRAGKTRRPKPI